MSVGKNPFSGTVSENYDRYIYPLNIEPFAQEMAQHLKLLAPERVLETAAGSGAATECLLSGLSCREYLMTDISEDMIAQARKRLSSRSYMSFAETDACLLPWQEPRFDAIVCLFGYMFFQDQLRALSESLRVLEPGGHLLMAVWDKFERCNLTEHFANLIAPDIGSEMPEFQKKAHACHSLDLLKSQLEQTGFTDIHIDVVTKASPASTPLDTAKAYICGTPLWFELQNKGINPEDEVRKMTAKLEQQHGELITGFTRQALFVDATKPSG
ncbi:class I SAM-dependent methyltransferase [Endozoicomonadaceae bacterium StTr2]